MSTWWKAAADAETTTAAREAIGGGSASMPAFYTSVAAFFALSTTDIKNALCRGRGTTYRWLAFTLGYDAVLLADLRRLARG